MQIVIPMSGFGERFRRAGFEIPKPLIAVEGKPIIQHVVELFPGDHDFVFICNEDHLANAKFGMRQILEATGVRHVIHPVAPHKLGPVHAVLSASHLFDLEAQTIVNYADFTCLWDFDAFCEMASNSNIDGVLPAYKGFHPHSGGTTNYAYIKEAGGLVEAVREKQPFTDEKTQEFASTGTYYFRNAKLMLEYLELQVSAGVDVGGEFYVSSAFDLMARAKKQVQVFEIDHFMQWGTPEDLAEYEFWSNQFTLLNQLGPESLPADEVDNGLLLASGIGSRFTSKGYLRPKPLLEVGGQTILEQVRKALKPDAYCEISSLVSSGIGKFVEAENLGKPVLIGELSGGQADSAKVLVDQMGSDRLGSFTVFPTDTLFAHLQDQKTQIGETPVRERLTVWAYLPNSFNQKNPENFGWIGIDDSGVWSAVKSPPLRKECVVMSGAFTFSSKDLFYELYKGVSESHGKVNGELYLDSMVAVAQERGVDIQIFVPNFTQSLGTPFEFESFRYWQSCFDQWTSHPYSLNQDPFVLKENVDSARAELRLTKHHPDEWGKND